MPELRIVLADDHAMVREGLRMLIDAQSDMSVIGQASNGQEAMRMTRAYQPDVVLMDIKMSGLSGVEATEKIKRDFPQVHVLALTRRADQGYLRRMLRAGASGYIVKKAAADQLINAIHTVVAGGTYIDPSLAGGLVNDVVGGPGLMNSDQEQNVLTARQGQVLRLIAWGMSNKEIAARLDISVKTVEYHKANAVKKLRLGSRTDILRYALAHGWLQDDEGPE